MATDVSICSNALLMLGAKPINALVSGSEGNADRVTLASNLWPQIRDKLLRSHPWGCATAEVLLAPDAVPPVIDYSARFLLPSDVLRILQVGEEGVPIDYKRRGRYLLADETVLPLVYVYRNEDVGLWDSALVDVATLQMAAAMAYAVTQSASLRDQFRAEAEYALKQAKAIDGQDEPPQTMGDFRQTMARRSRWF